MLAKADTLVLDKTGTLTYGSPEVVKIRPAGEWSEKELVETAAFAESRSEHPLGKAILRYVRQLGIQAVEPRDFSYVPGKGVHARAGEFDVLAGDRLLLEESRAMDVPISIDGRGPTSEILVARNGRHMASISIADGLRPEARTAVRALRNLGLTTRLLTGDARPVAVAVGRELGFDSVEAELPPEMKLQRVKALVEQGRTVAMVGDGINDAPAPAEASVGGRWAPAPTLRARALASCCWETIYSGSPRPFNQRATLDRSSGRTSSGH